MNYPYEPLLDKEEPKQPKSSCSCLRALRNLLGLVVLGLVAVSIYTLTFTSTNLSTLVAKTPFLAPPTLYERFTLTTVTQVGESSLAQDLTFVWRLVYDYPKNRLRVDALEIEQNANESVESYHKRVDVAKNFFETNTLQVHGDSVDILKKIGVDGPSTLIFDDSWVYGIHSAPNGETPVCQKYGHDERISHFNPIVGSLDNGASYVQGNLLHHFSGLNLPSHDGRPGSQKTDLWVDEFTGIPILMQAVGHVVKNEGRRYGAEVLHQVLEFKREVDDQLLLVPKDLENDVCVKMGGDIGMEWLLVLEDMPMMKNLWDVCDLQ